MALRTILRKHLEIETLKEILNDRYSTASYTDKSDLLKYVNDDIERKIEAIINSFLDDLRKGSQEVKKERVKNIIFAALTIASTASLGHAVNLKDIVYIFIAGLISLIIQVFQIAIKW